ncbi:MAG: hypothetical protein ACM3W4_03930 [Ignavibacteriales bacterium]
MEPGKTQLILKYEAERADEMFDENAITQPVAEQHQESISLFFERGVTERLTLQGKVGWTKGADLFTRYDGRGPIDLGARYVVYRNPRTVITVYGGGVVEGEGPDASHTLHRSGAPGFEVRLLAGRSGRFLRRHVFSELQLADLERGKLPRETRIETTLGIEPRRGWLVLAQTYAGREDKQPVAPLWLKAETSVLHDLPKGWRVQAGWRWTELGVEMPVADGPVLALWRTF